MSEFIDRVALAFTGLHITTADGSVVAPEYVARAAIEAMREPTGAMKEDGATHFGMCANMGSDVRINRLAAKNIWEGMIDAALRPTDTITDTAGNILSPTDAG